MGIFKKLVIFVLLVLNAAALFGVKPIPKIDIEPIESHNQIVWYLPKRDEEVEYWMTTIRA